MLSSTKHRSRRDAGGTASRPRSRADRSGRSRARQRSRAREIQRESAGNRGRDRTSRFERALPKVHANAYPPWYHSLHTSHCIMNCWGSYERPQKQYVADGSIFSAVTSIGRSSRDTVPSTTKVAWCGRSVGASRRAKRNGARRENRANQRTHVESWREIETRDPSTIRNRILGFFFAAEFFASFLFPHFLSDVQLHIYYII